MAKRIYSKVQRLCRAGCGQEVTIYLMANGQPTPSRQNSGMCRSCSRQINITGEKSYGLKALYELPAKKGKRQWLFLCDCGREVGLPQEKLGVNRSCGHLNKLPVGQSERNRILRSYKANAKRRGFAWELSDKVFDTLSQSSCHYCGDLPNNESHNPRSNGGFIYNGLDRKDNEMGYLKENVVACCKRCNFLKRSMSYVEFISLIHKISDHRRGINL
jgi:hypothetical protein